jgi:hypothetical protein
MKAIQRSTDSFSRLGLPRFVCADRTGSNVRMLIRIPYVFLIRPSGRTRSLCMETSVPEATEPWHSPARAWVPMMWLIRAVAIGLSMVLFEPLLRLLMPLA